MAKELNSKNFGTEIQVSKKALVDFWAPWCGPCRAQAPILEQLNTDSLDIFKVNVDENPELARQFSVMSIPALLVFENGQLINRGVGLHNLEQIKKLLKI